MSETTQDPLAPAAAAGGGREALRQLLLGAADSGRLSPAQMRLWDLEAASGPTPVHCFAIATELNGPLDTELLRNAVASVAARHPVLRSTIDANAEMPRFRPNPDLPLPFELREAFADTVRQEILSTAAQSFRLTEEPGWRAVLFRVGPDRHILLLQFHHILADRWSVAVFANDLSEAYTAPGVEQPLPKRPRSDEAWLESSEAAEQIAAWRRGFQPPPPSLRIPFTRTAADVSDYRGDRLERVVDPVLASRVRQLAAAEGTTMFPVLLTAFALTLRAHTGQDDLVICTPVTGRHRAGTREAIGYFNNILPLRLNLAGAPDFRAALSRVAEAARSAYANQDIPFHIIAGLDELTTVRTTACLFAVQNIPGLELRLPGVSSRYWDVPNGMSNFDLSVFLEEKDGELSLIADYKTALVDTEAAGQITARFLETLGFVVDRPEAGLHEFPRYERAPELEPSIAAVSEFTGPPALEGRLIGIFAEIFHDTEVTPESNFFHLGGDSVRAARLFARIRKDFGVELPLSTLFGAPTVRQLSQCIADSNWSAPWMSLVPIRAQGSRPPLYFVHGGGGNVISFRLLADNLGDDQPMYCLQAKGLKRGEVPLQSVEEMAARYIEAIREHRPHGPYALAGHSLGAAVAYEMAQRLMRDGEEVSFLGLLDHPGPNIRLGRADWLRYHYMIFSRLGGPERLHYLYHGLRSRWYHLRARSQSAAKRGRSTVEMLEAGMRALQSYKIEPYPGRITLFRARMGSPKILSDPLGGWNGVAAQGLEVHEVPGTHLSMLDHPNVEVLGAAIARCLSRN
jgi:thioesterase domain-containing protein/acyl carrier protein